MARESDDATAEANFGVQGVSRRAILSATSGLAMALGLSSGKPNVSDNKPTLTSADGIRILPCDNNELIRNPGKGYVLYNLKTKAPELWNAAAAGYVILSWHAIQPFSENDYDWSVFDDALRSCRDHGINLTIGVLCADSSNNQKLDVPEWVFRAGAKYTNKKIWNYLTGVTYEKEIPVWDDPVFLEKLEKFVAAFAKRYDGRAGIEYVENRAYGNWGEWHQIDINTEPPSEAIMRRMVDIYADHFTKTRLVIPCNCFYPSDWPEPFARYAVDQRGYGLERLGLVTLPDCIYGLQYCYDKGPAKAEWQSWYREYKKTGRWSDEYLDKTFLVGKFSYYNLGYWGDDSELYMEDKSGQIRYWANRMGYWFRLAEAYFPANLGNGLTETIVLKFRNDGVAPIYIKAYLKLAMMDSSYNVLHTTVLSGADPFGWKPGKVVTESHAFSFPYQESGTKLGVGLFTDPSLSQPDIKIGTAARRADGWHVLNDLIGTDTLVHFEDLPIEPATRLGWFGDDNSINGYAAQSKILHLDHKARPDMPSVPTYGGIQWGRGWVTWFNRRFYANGVRFNDFTVYKVGNHFRIPVGTVLKSLKLAGGGRVELASDGNPTRTFSPGKDLAAYDTHWVIPAAVVTVSVENSDGSGQVFFDDFVYGYPDLVKLGTAAHT